MSYADSLCERCKWYLSHEILVIDEIDEEDSEGDSLLVWENLILLHADNPNEAYDKAIQHGLASDGHVIPVDGKMKILRFKGLKNLILIYDELEDGAEIEWHQWNVKKGEIGRLLTAKENIQVFNLEPGENPVFDL